MNDIAGFFFVVAAVVAVADWAAVGYRTKTLEYLCKPLTLGLLVVVAATLDPALPDRRIWFIVALSLSLVGDVFLMLPKDLFVFGLASFLAGHVAYIGGFRVDGAGAAATATAAAVVLVVLLSVGIPVLRAVGRTERELGPPVVLYMLAIGAMATTALATGDVVASAGAVLFVSSDSLIAWNRFVKPRPWMPLAIIITYHLGQGLLTLSLV